MKICPKCNEKFESGKFCKFCGSALVEEEQELHCSNCGAKLDVGTKFCPNCGTKVEDSSENSEVDAVDLILSDSKDDAAKGFKLLKKSAEAGDTKSYFWLAKCYDNGNGCEENEELAFEWYKKGAEAEDSYSCWGLGRCYLYGIGTEEDDEQAFYWIQKAVDLNDENYSALKLLGDCYKNGWGTSENIGKAIECYKKAANGNNADAQNSLGLCYNNGEGLIKISKQRINISKKLLKMSHLQPWDRIFMQVIYSMVFVAKKIK